VESKYNITQTQFDQPPSTSVYNGDSA